MKLTVFSDCHGNLDNAIQILSQCQSDRYLFCGDGIRNAKLAADLLDKPLLAVLGNCDRGETGEAERLLELDGVRILLTHGHGYSVKASLLPLRRRALELGAQLVLYGHTHLPALANEDGVLFCNPGSCMDSPLCAEIELLDGTVEKIRLLHLDQAAPTL